MARLIRFIKIWGTPIAIMAAGVWVALERAAAWGDLRPFLVSAILNGWTIAGGLVTLGFAFYEWKIARVVPRLVYFRVWLCLCLPASAFLSWHEQANKWRGLVAKKPGVTIDPNYNQEIRPGRDWRLVVSDRNNPPVQFTVEIRKGSLFAEIRNATDTDRSAEPRTIIVGAPCPTLGASK